MQDYLVKCCRCRNKHLESERVQKLNNKHGFRSYERVCPRCECTTYYRQEEVQSQDNGETDNA